MTIQEQTDALYTDIYQLIARYNNEFDLQMEAIVGVMDFIKADLITGVTFQIDFDFDPEDDV